MIGDLVDGATTEVGRRVQDCLLGDASCEVTTQKNSTVYRRETRCVWDYVQSNLTEIFSEDDGTCSRLARQAVRLGFHDTCAWSQTSRTGGADGRLLLGPDEISRLVNNGMEDIREVGLDSDDNMARSGDLDTFIETYADSFLSQITWNADYSRAYVRLSLLGVNHINDLVDCAAVLPSAVTSFTVPANDTDSCGDSTKSDSENATTSVRYYLQWPSHLSISMFLLCVVAFI
ncbi:hypothetical protein ACJZ2D_001176 [Fusarium nematophilum]